MGSEWGARLALTRSTRMAPLASLAMEVPFRKAELGVEPAGRGAGLRCREALQGQGGNLGMGRTSSKPRALTYPHHHHICRELLSIGKDSLCDLGKEERSLIMS